MVCSFGLRIDPTEDSGRTEQSNGAPHLARRADSGRMVGHSEVMAKILVKRDYRRSCKSPLRQITQRNPSSQVCRESLYSWNPLRQHQPLPPRILRHSARLPQLRSTKSRRYASCVLRHVKNYFVAPPIRRAFDCPVLHVVKGDPRFLSFVHAYP